MFFKKSKRNATNEQVSPTQHENSAAPQWLSKNVLCQRPDQQLGELSAYFKENQDDDDPIRLVHLVNLYPVDGSLDQTQTATAESMKKSAESKYSDGGETVLVQVGMRDDADALPAGFVSSSFLERDILDIGEFKHRRSLPLLFDVLDRGAEHANPEDYIIYTNSDICLRPHFYGAVRQFIRAGFDALTINRMTVSDSQAFAPQVFVESEIGEVHRGFDCFVFRKSQYDSYVKSNSCLGIAGVARPLLYNMVVTSERLLMLKNVSMTYHFGNDRTWKSDDFLDYTAHNRVELFNTLRTLADSPENFLKLREFCINHPEPVDITASFLDGADPITAKPR